MENPSHFFKTHGVKEMVSFIKKSLPLTCVLVINLQAFAQMPNAGSPANQTPPNTLKNLKQSQVQPQVQTQPSPPKQPAQPQLSQPRQDQTLEIDWKPLPPQKPEPTARDSSEILSAIENLLNAIQNKQYDIAYNSYTSLKFKKTASLEEFKFFITGYPIFTNNKNAIFGNLEFKNQVAVMQGTLTSTDGQILRVEFFFIKENSLWKIIGIELIPA